MRLAQAARDLSITTDDIIAFLNKKGIEVEKDSNTKLNEESISLLFNYFGVETIEKNKPVEISVKSESSSEEQGLPESVITNSENYETDILNAAVTEQVEESNTHGISTENNSENTSLEKQDNSNTEGKEEIAVAHITIKEESVEEQEEVHGKEETNSPRNYKTVADILASEINNEEEDIIIKAPKVALKGLNVLGKIDLPEPKPKVEKENSENEADKEKPRREKRPKRKQKEHSTRNKRELTPQQIREREKKKEARKQEEAERLRKKKKEAYYKQRVLKPTQEKQKKTKPKKVKKDIPQGVKKEIKPQPTTLLGKFWRWLNT